MEPPSSRPSRSVPAAGLGAWATTQALAAFSDNYLRSALGWWVFASSVRHGAWPVALAGGVLAFALPSLLLSGQAGAWADLGDRRRVLLGAQLVGLGGGLAGAGALWAHSWPALVAAVVLCGIRAALLGPVKYALLPDLLPEERWLAGNAAVEAGTYVAALIGTAAGVLAVLPGWEVGAVVLAIWPAVGGAMSALRFTRVHARSRASGTVPGPFRSTVDALRTARAGIGVWRATLALAWFWLVAQGFVAWLPAYTVSDLGAAPSAGVGLAALFALGIACGSWAVHRLSSGWLELGVVPLGTVGISAFGLDLGLFAAHPARVALDLFGVAVSAAFLAVPLHTAVLSWTPPERRGRVVAAGNAIAALGMAAGAVLFAALAAVGWPVGRIWTGLAVTNLLVAAVIYRTAPEFLLRFLSWVLGSVLYRVEVTGAEHVPRAGPAVLVCNHVTYVDWLVLMGAVRRPARFVMYKGFFDLPVAGVLFRQAGVIPIAGAKEDPELLERAMDAVSATLRAGGVVAIFPEGSLTSDGEIHTFRPGIERIVTRDPVVVVPMALDGLWGSMFSRKNGTAFGRLLPRGVRSRVRVAIGAPIAPEEVTAGGLQRVVTALRG